MLEPVSSSMTHRKPRGSGMSWSLRLTVLLRTLIFAGFPLAGIVASFVVFESTIITHSYRLFVFILSITVILSNLSRRQFGRFDPMLGLFLAMYACRLLYDWQVADIPGADVSLLFFLVVVVVPLAAALSGAMINLEEQALAKSLVAIISLILILSFIAQQMGLGHNPWAQFGVENTRLMFESLNPISLGHAAGMACLCCMYLLLEAKNVSLSGRALIIGAGMLAAFMLVYANSRGPIIAVGLAMTWFFVSRFRRAVYVAPFLILVPLFLSAENQLLANVLERFDFDLEANKSIAGRILVQQAALEAFLNYPWFGAHYIDPQLGIGFYPHNITIETAMALGLAGLVMLFGMLFRAGWKVLSFYNRDYPLLTMVLVQQYVASSLSGALWASESFYLALALCLGAKQRRYQRDFADPRFLNGVPLHWRGYVVRR